MELDEKAFEDPREIMQEHGLSEEEAEKRYETFKTQIMLAVQEAERDWDMDQYEAVTDTIMSIQYQQAKMIEEMEESRMAKLARYLPKILYLVGFAGLAVAIWASTTTGPTIVSDALIGISLVVLFTALLLS